MSDSDFDYLDSDKDQPSQIPRENDENTLRVLCIGDPHFHTTNLADSQEFVKKTIQIVDQHQPDCVVCLGDVLHTHEKIHVDPLNLVLKFFEELSERVLTFLVIGNHDLKNHQQFLTPNHGFNALKRWKNMVIADDVIIHEIKGFDLYFVPYVPPGRFVEALNTCGRVWEMADCIFAHQEFKGCKMGAITSEKGDVWEDDYPPVISGHIHEAQYVEPNIYYIGSAMQHAFGENGEKRLWMVEFNRDIEGDFSYEKINLEMKQKKIVYLDFSEIDSFDENKYKQYHIKLNLRGNREQFRVFRKTERYKNLILKGIKITFTPEKIDIETIQNLGGSKRVRGPIAIKSLNLLRG